MTVTVSYRPPLSHREIPMKALAKVIDSLLRDEARFTPDNDREHRVSSITMVLAIVLLGGIYGASMGAFGILQGQADWWMQPVAGALKVPALGLLTLTVTYPSLYVFNALLGSRMDARTTLQLVLAGLVVMQTVLASFSPILLFFSFTTTNYNFIKLLNVVIFAVCGLLGLSFVLRVLRRVTAQLQPQSPTQGDPVDSERSAKLVFRFWVAVFGLVGAEMSWVLRPFIGGGPPVWFRDRSGSFFESVWSSLLQLLSGSP